MVDPSRINVANLAEEGLGNIRANSFGYDSAAIKLRIHKLSKTLDSGALYSHINGGPVLAQRILNLLLFQVAHLTLYH